MKGYSILPEAVWLQKYPTPLLSTIDRSMENYVILPKAAF